MKPVLLIDFGSTYTKVTAVDVEAEQLLGTADSYTTIETDVGNGLQNALEKLPSKIGAVRQRSVQIKYDQHRALHRRHIRLQRTHGLSHAKRSVHANPPLLVMRFRSLRALP